MLDNVGREGQVTETAPRRRPRVVLRLSTAYLIFVIGLAVFLGGVGTALAWPFLPGYDGYHLANYHLEWHYGSNFTGAWQNRAQDAVSTWTCCDGTSFHTHYDTAAPNHFYTSTNLSMFPQACNTYGTVPAGGYNHSAKHLPSTNAYMNTSSTCTGWTWNLAPGNPEPSQVDAHSVLAHEMGHMMNIGHGSSAWVMYPSISPGVTRQSLSSQDKWAVAEIYSCHPVPTQGC